MDSNTRVETMLKQLKKNIAFGIIGSYAIGASEDVIPDEIEVKTKQPYAISLGKIICKYGKPKGEGVNPLKLNPKGYGEALNTMKCSPIRITFLNKLIHYTNHKLDELYSEAYARTQNEKVVGDFILKNAKTLSEAMWLKSYNEGALDDELKTDIEVILKEGKERFEKRAQENQDKQDQQLSTTTQVPQEQPMEDQPMDGMDMGDMGDMGMDQQNDFSDQDLGLDQDQQDQDTVDYNDQNNEQPEGEDDIQMDGNGSDNSNDDINDIPDMSEFNEKFQLITPNATNTEEMRYAYSEGVSTTYDKLTLRKYTKQLLKFEQAMYKFVARSEGLDIINTPKYVNKAKREIRTLATVLATQHILSF